MQLYSGTFCTRVSKCAGGSWRSSAAVTASLATANTTLVSTHTGTRITLYEQLREWGSASTNSPTSLAAKLACGATAGAVGQLVAVPADLIKVREKMKADRVYMEKKVDRMQTVILESLNDN